MGINWKKERLIICLIIILVVFVVSIIIGVTKRKLNQYKYNIIKYRNGTDELFIRKMRYKYPAYTKIYQMYTGKLTNKDIKKIAKLLNKQKDNITAIRISIITKE